MSETNDGLLNGVTTTIAGMIGRFVFFVADDIMPVDAAKMLDRPEFEDLELKADFVDEVKVAPIFELCGVRVIGRVIDSELDFVVSSALLVETNLD